MPVGLEGYPAQLMIAVVDNYDSFTFNLVQYLWELEAEVTVYRNDEIGVEALLAAGPERVLISPGPCTPDQAGISLELARQAPEAGIPTLGVCLGHQAIAQAFGARIVRAERLMHGKTSSVEHDGRGVFTGLPSPLTATRYHSLIATDLPECFAETAWTVDRRELMGIRHRELPAVGVQFHPESFLTEHGRQLLGNFLEGRT